MPVSEYYSSAIISGGNCCKNKQKLTSPSNDSWKVLVYCLICCFWKVQIQSGLEGGFLETQSDGWGCRVLVHVPNVSRLRFVFKGTARTIEVLPWENDTGCYYSCFVSLGITSFQKDLKSFFFHRKSDNFYWRQLKQHNTKNILFNSKHCSNLVVAANSYPKDQWKHTLISLL